MQLLLADQCNYRPITKKNNEFWLTFLLPLSACLIVLKKIILAETISLYDTAVLFNNLQIIALLFLIQKFKNDISLASLLQLSVYMTLFRLAFSETTIIGAISDFLLLLYGFRLVFEYLIHTFPLSFTITEGIVVVEAILMFSYSFFGNIMPDFDPNRNFIVTFVQFVVMSVSGFGLLVSSVNKFQKPIEFLTLFALTIVMCVLVPFFNEMSALFTLIIQHIPLIIYWTGCSLIAFRVIRKQILSKKRANTAVRKTFHILAVLVYVPGLFFSPNLLFLASGLVFALFILIETCRVLCISRLASYLEDGFQVFSDSKDSGKIALTAIYLLCGLSLPIWLCFPFKQLKSYHFAGVLSVGIGDSFASFVGMRYGQYHWSDSSKSVEGSIAFFFSQVFSAFLLRLFLDFNMKAMFVSILAGTIFEAKTDQIDNLVLPLIQMIPLQIFE